MSHNSWTYLKPRTLIGCIFRWAGRCQSHSIVEQYEKYGVRIFDLRIKLDKNNKMVISHGMFKYKDSAEQLVKDLYYLNEKKDVMMRVLWEVRMYRYETEYERQWFINYCKFLEETYPNIRFFGGSPTHMCYRYYNFKPVMITKIQGEYSSKKCILLSWCPILYALFHNKRIKPKEDVIMLDFVERSKLY